jgi:hypothetical protein
VWVRAKGEMLDLAWEMQSDLVWVPVREEVLGLAWGLVLA